MRIAICGPVEPSQVLSENHVGRDAQGHGGNPISRLARALIATGNEVSVVSLTPQDQDSREFHEGNLSVYLVPMRTQPRELAKDLFKFERRKLEEVLRDLNPDIVNSQWTYEYALAAESTDLPHICTVRDAPFLELKYHPHPYRMMRLVMGTLVRQRIQTFAANSPWTAKRWKREMAYRGSMPVLPNIAPNSQIESRSKTLNSEILVVASSNSAKGVNSILRAWPYIREGNPEIEITFMGEGLDVPLRTQTRHLKEGQHWLGSQSSEQVTERMRAARMLLHAGRGESFCNVVLEAMAHGLPVVAGDEGAIPWVLGGTGEIANVRSPVDIAKHVTSILEDPERASLLSQSAAIRAQTEFGAARVAVKHLQVFEEHLK